jgi:RimJ/RimL family protein N-acetyltransferase
MNLHALLPIVTDRLSLDKFRPADLSDLHEIKKSPEHHRFNSERFDPPTEQQTGEYLSELLAQDFTTSGPRLIVGIRLTKTDRLIGLMGFKNGTLTDRGSIEIFYSFNHRFWNNGYATEAVRAICNVLFNRMGLHRIFAGCDIENAASKKVLEKAGMRFETRWRKDRIRNGQWTDGLGFAILEEDPAGS